MYLGRLVYDLQWLGEDILTKAAKPHRWYMAWNCWKMKSWRGKKIFWLPEEKYLSTDSAPFEIYLRYPTFLHVPTLLLQKHCCTRYLSPSTICLNIPDSVNGIWSVYLGRRSVEENSVFLIPVDYFTFVIPFAIYTCCWLPGTLLCRPLIACNVL